MIGLGQYVYSLWYSTRKWQTDTARRHRPHYAWRRVGKRQLRNIGQFYEKSGGSRGNYHHVWYGKTRMVGLPSRWWKKVQDLFRRSIQRDRQTEGQSLNVVPYSVFAARLQDNPVPVAGCKRGLCRRPVSVHLSVMFVYCVETSRPNIGYSHKCFHHPLQAYSSFSIPNVMAIFRREYLRLSTNRLWHRWWWSVGVLSIKFTSTFEYVYNTKCLRRPPVRPIWRQPVAPKLSASANLHISRVVLL